MHTLHLFSLVGTSLRRSEQFVLRFLVRPFSGLVNNAAPKPIKFTLPLAPMDSALGFLFFKVRSPTPWIFTPAGFSAVSDMENLSKDPLCSIGSHWRAASHKLSWWFPGCTMHSNISPFNSSVISGGFPILTLSLPCTSWGILLVIESVRCSWRGSEMFRVSNGVVDSVLHFLPGLHLSFKVLVLGLCCSFTLCPGECSPCLTTPWQWRPWWVYLSWDSHFFDGFIAVSTFPLIIQR